MHGGFRDVLELRRYVRVTTYELFADPPLPLVRRSLRLPVNERTRADGSMLKAVDAEEIARIAARLKLEDVKSVAICFLHAFSNPANERAAGELLVQLLPRVAISLSSDVLPQIKEFERSSTSGDQCLRQAANPWLSGQARDRGGSCRLPDAVTDHAVQWWYRLRRVAAEFPVRLIESGPVAGAVVAAAALRVCSVCLRSSLT